MIHNNSNEIIAVELRDKTKRLIKISDISAIAPMPNGCDILTGNKQTIKVRNFYGSTVNRGFIQGKLSVLKSMQELMGI